MGLKGKKAYPPGGRNCVSCRSEKVSDENVDDLSFMISQKTERDAISGHVKLTVIRKKGIYIREELKLPNVKRSGATEDQKL